MDPDPEEITDSVQDNSSSGLDGWGDPVDEKGAVGGAWPAGVGWGPGGAPGKMKHMYHFCVLFSS